MNRKRRRWAFFLGAGVAVAFLASTMAWFATKGEWPVPKPGAVDSPSKGAEPTERPYPPVATPAPEPSPPTVATPPSSAPSPPPARRPLPPPSPFPSPAAPSPSSRPDAEARVKQFLASLAEGHVANDIPRQMMRRQMVRVRARIMKGAVDLSGLAPEARATPIRVSPVMTVRLVGDKSAFDIVELSSELQAIGAVHRHGADWAWDVTPLKTGRHWLTLRVTAKDDDVVQDMPLHTESVEVTVTPWLWTRQTAGDHWQWLTTAIAIPMLVFVANRVMKRFKREKSVDDTVRTG